jgi:hypothetical protein
MVLVKNISTGARGAYLGSALIMAEAGQVIEADDFCEEWFEVDGEAEGNALGDLRLAELKALAEAEGVDLAGLTKKADIVSAIELAREAAEDEPEAEQDTVVEPEADAE